MYSKPENSLSRRFYLPDGHLKCAHLEKGRSGRLHDLAEAELQPSFLLDFPPGLAGDLQGLEEAHQVAHQL